ncbi:tyrosine-type recombinase/integrase, partial [Enterococcus faecalis]|uniref:tyrosine-type recombinase/integrase n=1 Tax=Enterococcus faecalis TaxID=1351 RepID=UPI003984E1AF
RRSEVLGLKWSAIDFLNKKIMINHVIIENPENMSQLINKDQTKNSSSYRTLPLVETIERALVNQAKWQQDNRILLGEDYILKDSEYVFTMEDGRLMKPQYVTHRLSKLIKKNGLKKIRFHDLRHS